MGTGGHRGAQGGTGGHRGAQGGTGGDRGAQRGTGGHRGAGGQGGRGEGGQGQGQTRTKKTGFGAKQFFRAKQQCPEKPRLRQDSKSVQGALRSPKTLNPKPDTALRLSDLASRHQVLSLKTAGDEVSPVPSRPKDPAFGNAMLLP